MTVHLEQVGDEIQFRARNESGYTFTVGSEEGHDGVRPMQMVALSLGSCSSIDILTILQKQRQTVDQFEVDVDAERATDEVPAVFTSLHVHYRVDGDVTADKMRRAIELSLGKHCSVSRMHEATVSISYAYTVNGTTYDGQLRQPES